MLCSAPCCLMSALHWKTKMSLARDKKLLIYLRDTSPLNCNYGMNVKPFGRSWTMWDHDCYLSIYLKNRFFSPGIFFSHHFYVVCWTRCKLWSKVCMFSVKLITTWIAIKPCYCFVRQIIIRGLLYGCVQASWPYINTPVIKPPTPLLEINKPPVGLNRGFIINF